MLQLIRDLLNSRSFWGTLVAINVMAMALQPLMLFLTAGVVLGLYTILGLGNFVQSRSFPRFLLICLFLILIGVSTFFCGAFLEWWGYQVRTSKGLLTAAFLTVLLWAMPLLLYRWAQRRRKRKQALAVQQQVQRERAAQAEETRRQAAAQRRRDDARHQCEVFWHTHAPEIQKRFSRARFDDFVQQQMGDELPAEIVAERAQQLLGIMQKHLEKTGHVERKKSLADIAAWFLEEKTKIDALPLNAEDKEQMIADLEARFTDLQQKYIRSMNP